MDVIRATEKKISKLGRNTNGKNRQNQHRSEDYIAMQ